MLVALVSGCQVQIPDHFDLPRQLTGGDPRTLEAATAAAQERVNRFSSGDYAGAWLLSSQQMRNSVTQNDYVSFQLTCASAITRLPTVVTGIRMDGPGRAIVRQELLGVQDSFAMVYEDGRWVAEPTGFWIRNAGRTAQEIVADARAEGICGDTRASPAPTTSTVTAPPSSPPVPSTTGIPVEGAVVPGTRYAFPAAYSRSEPAEDRPSELQFDYRSHRLINLVWSSWNADGAQASGDETVETSCTPDCSSGPAYTNVVQVRASKPQAPPPDTGCPADVLFFTDVVVSYPAADPPAEVRTALQAPDIQWSSAGGVTFAHYLDRRPYCEG